MLKGPQTKGGPLSRPSLFFSRSGTGTDYRRFVSQDGTKGMQCMRYERAYARRQRAVTFASSSTRTVTIPLEIPDFERLERLAAKHNVGNATLGRQILRKYLQRQPDESIGLNNRQVAGAGNDGGVIANGPPDQ